MATRDETRIPLLASTDENGETEEPLIDDVEVEYALRTPPRDGLSGSSPQGTSDGGRKVRKKHYSGSEMIVAVFVVAFDTKKGSWIG